MRRYQVFADAIIIAGLLVTSALIVYLIAIDAL